MHSKITSTSKILALFSLDCLFLEFQRPLNYVKQQMLIKYNLNERAQQIHKKLHIQYGKTEWGKAGLS